MAYNKTTWINGVTVADEDNMNNIEKGIEENSFESGSNENGNWIKYFDGTMIQTGTIDKTKFKHDSSYSTTVQGIIWYRSNDPQINFPNAFINEDYSIQITPQITGLNGSRLIIPRLAGKRVDNFTMQLIGVEDFIETGVAYANLKAVDYIAIGRWK